MIRRYITACLSLAMLFGCNVDDPKPSTGGVDFGGGGNGGEGGSNSDAGGNGGSSDSAGAAGLGQAGSGQAGSTASTPAKQCERGLVVVMGDYKSTNVGITKLDGTPLSSSFISSGAAKPGLALALSGDVDVPRAAPTSKRVVLIDRFGSNVITWMDLESATVLAQLRVGTGFESNPQDYAEFDTDRAVISRYGTNSSPGHEDFDQGGDLLVIDTKTPKILERIAMPEENTELLPRPAGITKLGDVLVVALERLSFDFDSCGEGRFVGVSPKDGKIVYTVDIPKLKNCGRLAISPSGKLGAVACSSQFDGGTYRYNPEESDVVIFDLTVSPPKEMRRLGLGVALDAGLQPSVEFASEDHVLALAYGGNSTVGDRAVLAEIDTGKYETVAESKGPYNLSGIHCSPGCGDVCVISDGETGKLRRFTLGDSGKIENLSDITVDTTIGLPPRRIGAL
ncbi:MAG: hypothetical protein QM784_37390 [Polyangiaceae bacterium]